MVDITAGQEWINCEGAKEEEMQEWGFLLTGLSPRTEPGAAEPPKGRAHRTCFVLRPALLTTDRYLGKILDLQPCMKPLT